MLLYNFVLKEILLSPFVYLYSVSLDFSIMTTLWYSKNLNVVKKGDMDFDMKYQHNFKRLLLLVKLIITITCFTTIKIIRRLIAYLSTTRLLYYLEHCYCLYERER